MGGNGAAGLLQLITSAITPVVLLSAAASLIISINQKQANVADRLRSLAAEYRQPETVPERCATIRAQVRLLDQRFRRIALAHIWLHIAVAAFGAMIMILTLTRRTPFWDACVLGLFVGGVCLIMAAMVMELMELHLARRTVVLDIEDVLHPDAPRRCD
jgi:hypothetical protein